nr:hypothetical protein K-LCC10_0376 [Kaumoebavirus]
MEYEKHIRQAAEKYNLGVTTLQSDSKAYYRCFLYPPYKTFWYLYVAAEVEGEWNDRFGKDYVVRVSIRVCNIGIGRRYFDGSKDSSMFEKHESGYVWLVDMIGNFIEEDFVIKNDMLVWKLESKVRALTKVTGVEYKENDLCGMLDAVHEHILYAPGGLGAEEAEDHFKNLI